MHLQKYGKNHVCFAKTCNQSPVSEKPKVTYSK